MNDAEEMFVEEGEENTDVHSENNCSDEASTEREPTTYDELALLKEELEALREEIRARDEREAASSRMLSELREFEQYFPEADIHQIPDEVWERVKKGASLSASFALNLRKMEIERKRVSDFNEKNRRMSSGSLISGDEDRFFSPSEVKRMTPAQVKSHYDEIIESMRHWN